jgi:saccharopine dehydrogenase (NAD+, L-lysine-forming)
MSARIGIRREDKNRWERRVPLVPDDVRVLRERHALDFVLQPSQIRIFPDEAYTEVGASIDENLTRCPVVLAVKEIPLSFFQPGRTYVFFSHVIKGQSYNMPMLKKVLELGCQLIDYEKVADDEGRRLIFFGKHAGLAGMIDALWALGQRLRWEGIGTPLARIKHACQYDSLAQAEEEIARAGEEIASQGLPESLAPLIVGIAGYGHVSRGAQEILGLLPVEEIAPGEVMRLEGSSVSSKVIYKAVFREEHTVAPVARDGTFELQDYYDHPEKYRTQFPAYVPHLTVLMNCIYWEERYPRLVTKEFLRELYGRPSRPRLRVIGDISCDIEGAIECTVKWTDPEKPIFVYNPSDGTTRDGYEGTGPVVLAVDNLPCEIPRESSIYFSNILREFVPAIAAADPSVDLRDYQLPSEIKRAVIVYQGELTPEYRYLEEHL